MNADLIIVWPTNCDYPLFRSFLRINRSEFAKVIISFTEVPHGDDFQLFVIEAMKEDDCIFALTPASSPGDWRNNAVNYALLISNAKWVWFMEQDFLITKDVFWRKLNLLMEENDVVSVKEDERLHPCCLLIRREILDKTRKDFGIIPDKLDHFGMIQQDLEAMDIRIGIIDPEYYHHMAGLSHNYTLAHDAKEIGYKPAEFKKYLEQCLMIVNVPLDPRFIRVAKSIIYN